MSAQQVAVIGTGSIGTVVAENLVKGGRKVIIADRKLEKAQALASALGAVALPLEEAFAKADILVFAIWFNAIKEVLVKNASVLKGKVIVDPSNPIAPDEKGGFTKIIGVDESAGQQIGALLPAGAVLVKAFGTLGAASLREAAFQPERKVLFYATDDRSVDAAVETLIADAGFDAVRVGGIDASIRIEVFGDLHEFGALGRTITAKEAKLLSNEKV